MSILKGVNGRGYIHTSDKLEIFFSGRVFSAAKDPILFTMAKVAKALCTGQRH